MPNDAPPSVAVVGAAGFVGRELLGVLREREIRATAVVRGHPDMVAGRGYHDVCMDPAALPAHSFDGVINLAYPTSGSTSSYPRQTHDLFATLERLVRDGGHLTHASTLAVFGTVLERPIAAAPVERFRAEPYVEAKVAAEHEATARQAARGLRVDIVRLGNVIGPASGMWTSGLVQRLLTERPVLVAGKRGLSNATEVANVAAYLAFLHGAPASQPSVRYHHLAEFSSVPWREWVDALAVIIGAGPREADAESLAANGRVGAALAAPLAAYKPGALYQTLASHPVGGSWTRSLLRRLPDRAVERVKGVDAVTAPAPPLRPDDRGFLATMSIEQEFRSALAGGWTAPVTKDAAIERMADWLRRDWELP